MTVGWGPGGEEPEGGIGGLGVLGTPRAGRLYSLCLSPAQPRRRPPWLVFLPRVAKGSELCRGGFKAGQALLNCLDPSLSLALHPFAYVSEPCVEMGGGVGPSLAAWTPAAYPPDRWLPWSQRSSRKSPPTPRPKSLGWDEPHQASEPQSHLWLCFWL